MKIFNFAPELQTGNINIDACYRHHYADCGLPIPKISPCLGPQTCDALIQIWQKERNLKRSRGGYMENRSAIWAGSYLEGTGKWIHLGVDFNAPIGTPINVPRRATVVLIDDDTPDTHGWGNRVIMRDEKSDLYVIYAHLARNPNCSVGEVLEPDKVFARIGSSYENGFWYPHLHVQALTPEIWEYYRTHLKELDGYGHVLFKDALLLQYPNPVVALEL